MVITRYYNNFEFKRIMEYLPKVKKLNSRNMFFKWYRLYLLTQYWQGVRKQVIFRAGNKCELCKFYDINEIHHLSYKFLGKERLEFLKGLCCYCHRDKHNKIHGLTHISEILPDVIDKILINVKTSRKNEKIKRGR